MYVCIIIYIIYDHRKARERARGAGRARREAGIGSENFLERGPTASGGSDAQDLGEVNDLALTKTKPKRKAAVEVIEEAPVVTITIGWKGTVGSTSQDRYILVCIYNYCI